MIADRKSFSLLASLSVLGFLGGCHFLSKPASTDPSFPVTKGDVTVSVIALGTIEPLSKVDVKSKVAGRIQRLFVHEGDVVHAGQILATIDPQQINSQVAALRAQLDQARAQLASALKNVAFQKLQTSTTIAQDEQNVDSARARLRQTLTQSNVQPRLTAESVKIAQANLASAQATLKAQQDALKLMLTNTNPNAIITAQTSYDQAHATEVNATAELKRQVNLNSRGYVSDQALDTARAAQQVAVAQLQDAANKLATIRQANTIQAENLTSQIESAKAQVSQMEAALVQAQADTLPMTRKDDVSAAQAALKLATAQLASAQSGVLQNMMRKDDAAAASANVQQIRNQLDAQIVQQHDTTLYAPMTGVVTKRYVEQGDLITSGIDSFSSGTPVYQVADLQTMLVKIPVNEVDIDKIKKGMRASISVDAVPGVTFVGVVDKVAPAASSYTSTTASTSTSGDTGVIKFPVEIRIDHADPRLRPGMTANCTVIVAQQLGVLRLPEQCIIGTGSNCTVLVVRATTDKKGNAARVTNAVPVTVGLRGSNYAEIVSGVSEGTQIQVAPYSGPKRQGISIQGGP